MMEMNKSYTKACLAILLSAGIGLFSSCEEKKKTSRDIIATKPVVLEKNKQMIFRKWDCSNESLVANSMFKNKILEPNKTYEELQPTIVFTPAVAVDIYGNRIGYGGGYYDRTLQDINCLKIATIYDFQLFKDKFNVEKNDIKMDYILTEKIFKKI